MTDNSIPSFETMLNALGRAPLRAIQLAAKAQGGVNQRSWEVAGIGCGFARILIDDEKHRGDFYDEEFFDDLKRRHPDKLLLHVFAYLYGSLRGPAYNRASEHARALKKVCDDRDIEVADIPQYIADHGGFDGLLNEQGDQGDDQPDDQEVNSDRSSKHGSGTSRIAQRPATQGPTLTSDDDDSDEDDLVPGADGDGERVVRPQRKAFLPESSEPKLTSLSRDYIVGCILVQPKNDAQRDEILRALRLGKKVLMTLVPGEPSLTHELYSGAGGFIPLVIDDHDFC